MTQHRRTLLAAAAWPVVAALPTRSAQAASLSEAVSGRPQLGILASLIRLAGLEGQLRSQRGITLFAPTNAAFEALPAPAYRRLAEPARAEDAAAFLRAHMATWADPIPTDGARPPALTSLGGTPLTLRAAGGDAVRVNGRRIQAMNIRADNGFLHIVSEVLSPP